MSFSRAQQPEFRKLVAAAWQQHVRETGATKAQERAWYEAELWEATGHDSTTDCNAGRDYDLACAHFEALAGVSIRWQMKVHSGDATRIIWHLDEITRKHGIDAPYLRGIARQALRCEELPELADLPREQLIQILGETKRFVRRRKHRAEVSAEPPVEAAELGLFRQPEARPETVFSEDPF